MVGDILTHQVAADALIDKQGGSGGDGPFGTFDKLIMPQRRAGRKPLPQLCVRLIGIKAEYCLRELRGRPASGVHASCD